MIRQILDRGAVRALRRANDRLRPVARPVRPAGRVPRLAGHTVVYGGGAVPSGSLQEESR